MASGSAVAAPWTFLGRVQDLILPVAIIASVLVILVPLPPALMDVLLAANITIAVIMLLTTIYVRTPLEFSIFPSLLLATTLAGWCSTWPRRGLILTRAGTDGLHAAGGVVTAFGEFVAGDGEIVVGMIIFVIIVVIQFVVITKGATRISEVAARFALDGMPGKQMAIDADLNAGIIDEREAQRAAGRNHASRPTSSGRWTVPASSSAAMRSPASSSRVINIVGGLIIGMVEHGMTLSEGGRALHAADDRRRPGEPGAGVLDLAGRRLARHAQHAATATCRTKFMRAAFFAAAGAGRDGRLPGDPGLHELAADPAVRHWRIVHRRCRRCSTRRETHDATAAEAKAAKQTESQAGRDERVEDYLTVDPMEIELGVGLIRLADPNRGGDLLDRVQRVRQNVAGEIGILLPKVRIRDNMRLEPQQYRIKIADMPVAHGDGRADAAAGDRLGHDDRPDRRHRDEGSGLRHRANWIDPALANQAEMYGYTVVEPGSVLATHLTEVCRRHADEILTRDATKHLIDELKTTVAGGGRRIDSRP